MKPREALALHQITWSAGYKEGTEDRLAEIVAWLRSDNGAIVTSTGIGTLYSVANQLESGAWRTTDDQR